MSPAELATLAKLRARLGVAPSGTPLAAGIRAVERRIEADDRAFVLRTVVKAREFIQSERTATADSLMREDSNVLSVADGAILAEYDELITALEAAEKRLTGGA